MGYLIYIYFAYTLGRIEKIQHLLNLFRCSLSYTIEKKLASVFVKKVRVLRTTIDKARNQQYAMLE